jgi:Na+/H+ antiporter NhaC
MGIIPDKYIYEISQSIKRKWRKHDGKPMNGWLALSPLAVFLCIYLVSSLIAGDFYAVPISAAFLIASIYAVLISREGTLDQKIAVFSEGAGNKNVLLMIWIFVLAGAFASTAKEIGAIDATVNLALRILPGNLLYAGLFLAACFISMSIGTSVGTIVALVPVAAGIAEELALTGASGISASTPFITAIIAGGAFFGDNLSFISDTTIAATRIQGCSMADKFKTNIRIVGPAAIIVTVLYIFLGANVSAVPETGAIDWILLIPYILVIALALSGINVAAVLTVGLFVNGTIGLGKGILDWTSFLSAIGSGISGMGDLIIVTMLAGGMLEIIRTNGGLDFIVKGMTRKINGKRGAELSIAGLVSLANLCTANNTIAIITSGQIAKDITERFGLDPRKTASILDTFSCLVQGFIPYGAQILMAAGLSGASSISIIGYLYYPFIMGAFAFLAILFRMPRKYS